MRTGNGESVLMRVVKFNKIIKETENQENAQVRCLRFRIGEILENRKTILTTTWF
jgi:hypothetical protein